MYIPFISSPSTSTTSRRRLFRRKGGGGGGRGGGSRGGRSGSSGSSGGGGSSGASGSRGSVSTPGFAGSRSISSSSSGGGAIATVPSGAFAGRSVGGGTRNQVFGTRQYGSGYPGVVGAGVAGRGFPFYFWPVTWGGAAGVGTAAYLHNRNDDEYGRPDNSSRPGGATTYATFVSNASSGNNTYHIVADNSTVASLVASINSKCSSFLDTTTNNAGILPFNASLTKPENAIQYYRASSVVLTLDGYNNSAVFSNDTNAPDSPLPTNLNMTVLDCLNRTIGESVPLVDAATSSGSNGAVGMGGRTEGHRLTGVIALVVVF
ncbi:hypothetical protein V5O48_008304, partial [Marasmius crinis-equi]